MSTGNQGGGNRGSVRAAANVIAGGGVPGSDPAAGNVPPELAAQHQSLREREDLLKRAEAELLERQRELAEREEQLKSEMAERGRALRPADQAYRGPGDGYEFEVGPTPGAKKLYPELRTVRVMAVDESEAKRWYCATVEDPRPNRRGRQIDPVAIDIAVRCIDERRQRDLNLAYMVAAARRKREAGQPLSEQEAALLSQAELAMPL